MTCLNNLTMYVVISVLLVVPSHNSNVLQSAEYGILGQCVIRHIVTDLYHHAITYDSPFFHEVSGSNLVDFVNTEALFGRYMFRRNKSILIVIPK